MIPNRQAQIQLQQQQQQQQQQVQLMQQMQPQGIQIKRKKPCYEFIRKGKCQRGNSCNFEHVTLEQAQMMGLQLPQNLLNLQQAQQQQQQQGMMRPPMGVNGQFMMAPQQRPQGQMPGMMAPQAGGFFRPQMMQPQQQHRQFGGNVRPHHMANASNGHDASGQPPQQLSATAVFVTNIPDDHLSEQHVTEFFGKFGEIQNIRIDYNKHNAIVDFKDSNAQQQAISTPEAIFNNRFVRIHKAREQAAASANANTNDTDSTRPPVAAATPAWRPKSAAIKKAELIEKYVEQQKELMKKITTTKNMPPATRKIIMQSIAEIQKKMDDINNKHKGAAAAAAPSAAAPSVSAASSVSQGTSGATDNTQAATESTEAENQQQEQPAAATAADAVQNEKLALQAKLKALEEEAQRLGMSTGAKPFQLGRGGSAAATRGRGGRGGWAGARGSMSLDKRSRTLVLKNVGQDAAERLDSEMAQFGEVEMMDKLEDNNEAPFTYAVKFKARWEAENAMKAIHSIASFESVSAEWDQ
ncbi:hypothetical protein GGI12_002533 [Dipsacomyces acuminosporus]|nr:hypothetical protein GGI12_002533 [Dipsacomyces acuminosporus]